MQTKWAEIKKILENHLTSGQYKVWIDPLCAQVQGDTVVVTAQNEFVAGFIRSRFFSLLQEVVGAVMGEELSVVVAARAADAAPRDEAAARPQPRSLARCAPASSRAETGPALPAVDEAHKPAPRPLAATQLSLPLRMPAETQGAPVRKWRFSFENFIVGSSNEMAYAASKSMCAEFQCADILYLSSPPGLGKTHLLQAVGKNLSDACNRSAPKVEYLTAEEFASRFYFSLKTGDTNSFKARYRDADLLLLEDVHFLQGKEKMQSELLATVKSLQDKGSKVVFTSSFAPGDLRDMDDQLLSRLSSGLLSFIGRPDEETRKRILRHKASLHQVLLPPDVEELLARHIHADVRQIESCLQNLILKARLFNSGITMQMALEVIGNYASQVSAFDLEGIIAQVCRCFNLSRDQLSSVSRKQEYVAARNTAFYLARKHTDLSLGAIGQQFNRRHSTVLKGITNLEREISRQTPLGRQLASTLAMIERTGDTVQFS